jgi:uncharacterized protein with von Willebrand factor type A (vWA) domain
VQKKILEFAQLLRKSGVRVSPAETLDALAALDEVAIDDRAIFRDALRATMVKRGDDVPSFDELFELFWSGFYDNLREAFAAAGAELAEAGLDLDELLEQIAAILRDAEGEIGEFSDLARALLSADLTQLESLIRQAAARAGVERIQNFLQVGFFSRRTAEQLGMEGAGDELRDLATRLEAAGMAPDQVAALRALIEELMAAARRSVRAFTERELQKQSHDYMERFRRETLLEKSFYHLTEEEIRRMREVVERLAQRIKNILSIRRRRLKRGKLDLHQTLRRNMAHGGIPFERIFKQRRKVRPKLVILTDVSSSVANVSRFMLQFVYALQEAFNKIRSFVFVAALELRVRLSSLLAAPPGGDRQQDHRPHPGRRAQQLQRSARLVPARHPRKGKERGVAESGESECVGIRRQRDGRLPAVLRRGRGVPQSPPAVARRRQAVALGNPSRCARAFGSPLEPMHTPHLIAQKANAPPFTTTGRSTGGRAVDG